MAKKRGKRLPKSKFKKPRIALKAPWLMFVAITAILATVAYSGTKSNAETTFNNPGPGEINITHIGFKPNKLNTKVGSPVTWNNVDARSHQVIIDSKESDSPVLGFDNHLILRPGDSYSFSFIHPGTYYYRDRMTGGPAFRGSVVVR